jgi:hypothetical protein
MRDEDIFNKLFQGVERWPRKDRPAAEEWLARAAASIRLIREIEAGGIAALLTDNSAAPAHSR